MTTMTNSKVAAEEAAKMTAKIAAMSPESALDAAFELVMRVGDREMTDAELLEFAKLTSGSHTTIA